MTHRLKKIFTILLLIIALITAVSHGANAAESEDNLLGVREGWSWPIVVIQPPEGWESEAGNSIKLAKRTAEREISLNREAIRGREVTFMFSDISDPAELKTRLATWRAMKVGAIVTFADASFNAALGELCMDSGPSILHAGGEDIPITSPETGRPYPYLFALELPYYARANALAEAASVERPGESVAVFTDILSARLARGAELTSQFLKSRGMAPLGISAAAYRQDQFSPQIREMESEGTDIYICWLDAMATLSIWQTLERRNSGSVVYYSGPLRQILTDADGIVTVDKDVLLERNPEGHRVIINKIRDAFDTVAGDPVTAAKAYALAQWVIEAYKAVGSGDTPRIALALAEMRDIPLMDETLAIDPGTHRPKSRKYGLLRIGNKHYESYGSVDVFSAETTEQ